MSIASRIGAIEHRLHPWPFQYGFALAVVSVAALAQYAVGVAVGPAPRFILFYPTVMLVALLTGFRPALFATLLSTAVAQYFFMEPAHSLAIRNRPDLVALILFAIIGAAISWVGDLFWRRTRRLAEFEKAVEGLEEMLVVVDRNYRCVIANRAYLDYRGMKRKDSIGRRVSELLDQQIFEKTVKEKLDQCFQGHVVQFEMRFHYPGRGERDMSIAYFPIEGPGGIDRVACVLQDITERKRAQDALRESEDRYRDLVEHSQDLVCTHDLEGRLLSVNPAAARGLGYDVSELLNIPMHELIPAEFRQQFDGYLDRIRTAGVDHGWLSVAAKNGELRLWKYDNTLRTEGVASPIVRGMARDVTEEKRAERALRYSERRYRTLFERTVAGVAIVTQAGQVIDCNDAWARMFGHNSASECRGGQVQACYIDLADRTVLVRELDTHGWYSNREVQLRRRDGTPFWALLSGTLLPQGQDEPLIQTSILDITERRAAEEALRESQQRLTGIIASAMDAIITVDEEQRIVLFNAAAEKMFLCSQAEAMGQSIDRFIPARFRGAHHAHVNKFVESGFTTRAKGSLDSLLAVRANGEEFQMEASISKIEAGRKRLLTVILRDISERRRTESELKATEDRLRLFIEHAPAALAMFDREMRYLHISRRWRTDYGLPEQDFRGISHYDLFPDIPVRWKEAHRRGLAGETLSEENDQFERADGSIQWVHWEVRPWLDRTGAVGGIVILTEDVSERKKVEERLQEYARVVEGLEEMILVVDRQYRYVIANRAFLNFRGLSAHQVIGHSVEEVVGKDVFESSVKKKMDECFHGRSVQYELTYDFPKLGKRDLWATYFPITGRDGVDRLAGILQDITERKMAENALRKSEERFSKAFRSNPLAITISTKEEGRYLDVNDAFLDMLGYTRKEVIGRTSADIRFWHDPLDRSEMFRQLAENKHMSKYKARYRTANGETREAEIWAELIELDGRECLLGITRDITEMQRLETQFRQAQKMEAVGRLAGGVAHDFNNILGIIMGYSDLAIELVAPENPVNRYISETRKAAHKAALLTQQLLAFSRKQVTFPKILDLNEAVRNATNMFLRLVGEDVTLEFPAIRRVRDYQGRSGTSGSGHHEPGGKCARRHAHRRPYCHRDRSRRIRRRLCFGASRFSTRTLCNSSGQRHRMRHG